MRFPESIIPQADVLLSVRDGHEMGRSSALSSRLPPDIGMVQYTLSDRRLARTRFELPYSTHSRISVGHLHLTRIVDRFQTEMLIGGDGLPRYWFSFVNRGVTSVTQGAVTATASGASGFVVRGLSGTRAVNSDANIRTNLWIDAAALEAALASLLDDEVRHALHFETSIDWSRGLAASVVTQTDYLVSELGRSDGLASNPLALAAFEDLVLRTLLLALRHNYSDRLSGNGAGAPIPRAVYRAEEFMRANATEPLRMHQVAAAVNCSVRALELSFRRFRNTTPLGALRSIRLEQVRDALQRSGETPVTELARQYGFTNAARFTRAYLDRFGEHPSEAPSSRKRTSAGGQ